jgi:hypothetical protein
MLRSTRPRLVKDNVARSMEVRVAPANRRPLFCSGHLRQVLTLLVLTWTEMLPGATVKALVEKGNDHGSECQNGGGGPSFSLFSKRKS